uniref:Reverse transcriptase domain-containing protein n=1 Tax=Tanacetum cinerariifolium TaxID=118510 RepID=A0A6L2N4R2_TANCI|nr:reverse transcriptase domain-containing protein [Tanacetum cinerariifolium]
MKIPGKGTRIVKGGVVAREEQMSRIRGQVILRTRSNFRRRYSPGLVSLEKTRSKEDVEEIFTISHERPDQYAGSESTIISRFFMEQQLKMYPLAKPVVHTKRPVAPEGRLALKEIRKERKELSSLMGYPYKCFLLLSKEYNQIRMAEDDEEKTGFHTKEGPRWENDPGKLGAASDSLREEGLRVDPERIQAIILSPTPRSPNQIRSLFLQLTAISKFIPKLAELKHHIREAQTRMETAKESGWTNEDEESLRKQYLIRKVRMRFETTEGSGWTNKAEKALQRIKRKLNKLQTLVVLKEGEILMLCLRQKDKTISFVLLIEREGIQIHVSYTEGNHTSATEQERKYKKEIMDATASFHRFQITHLPKKLNSKVEALTRLATIKLEFLNQKVSVGIITRPSVEETSSCKKGKATSNVPGAKPNYNWKASGSN